MSILYIIKIKKQKYYILCFVIEIKIIFKNAVTCKTQIGEENNNEKINQI